MYLRQSIYNALGQHMVFPQWTIAESMTSQPPRFPLFFYPRQTLIAGIYRVHCPTCASTISPAARTDILAVPPRDDLDPHRQAIYRRSRHGQPRQPQHRQHELHPQRVQHPRPPPLCLPCPSNTEPNPSPAAPLRIALRRALRTLRQASRASRHCRRWLRDRRPATSRKLLPGVSIGPLSTLPIVPFRCRKQRE